IKDYGYGVVFCIVNILHSICFIAVNIWKWWNWDEVWGNICKIGKNAYKINNYIDRTSDESFGTLLSVLNLFITSITTLDNEIKVNKTLSKPDESMINIKKLEIINNTTLTMPLHKTKKHMMKLTKLIIQKVIV
ncbi:MAG: hypothetical protein PHY59_06915, partial [Methanobacterium sp.]|nr:hypothetical protein [Methanobacterium sp.]